MTQLVRSSVRKTPGVNFVWPDFGHTVGAISDLTVN